MTVNIDTYDQYINLNTEAQELTHKWIEWRNSKTYNYNPDQEAWMQELLQWQAAVKEIIDQTTQDRQMERMVDIILEPVEVEVTQLKEAKQIQELTKDQCQFETTIAIEKEKDIIKHNKRVKIQDIYIPRFIDRDYRKVVQETKIALKNKGMKYVEQERKQVVVIRVIMSNEEQRLKLRDTVKQGQLIIEQQDKLRLRLRKPSNRFGESRRKKTLIQDIERFIYYIHKNESKIIQDYNREMQQDRMQIEYSNEY
ncbi:hypothetical protein OXYTRIMIC_165 [Oxytricha trifallax]|uniref:Uncharacterized protein n=1 Tax=Oxytricha trifallax TaxID=1172189 RepID=A0A073IBZ7_9SPIT|nr:hypothetical protein OXYTRIMIC_165 [Oxytricha trifallax]